jgi:hypothetical protein
MQHYEQVAGAAQPRDLSGALAAIFHSPQTGTFGQNIASLFGQCLLGQSEPNQRAGILNTLLSSGEAGVLSGLGLGSATSQVTPEQAQHIPLRRSNWRLSMLRSRILRWWNAPANSIRSIRSWFKPWASGRVAGIAASLPSVTKAAAS